MLKVKRAFSLLLLVLVASCGEEVCKMVPSVDGADEFTTSDFSVLDIEVHPNGNEVSPVAVETAVDITVDILVERFPHIYSKDTATASLSGFVVEFTNDIIPCSGANGCYGTIRYSTKTITLFYNKCIAYTSFSHELLHFFLLQFEFVQDSNHTRTDIFREPDSVEVEAEKSTSYLVCLKVREECE